MKKHGTKLTAAEPQIVFSTPASTRQITVPRLALSTRLLLREFLLSAGMSVDRFSETSLTSKGFVQGNTVYCQRPLAITIDRLSRSTKAGPGRNDRFRAKPGSRR